MARVAAAFPGAGDLEEDQEPEDDGGGEDWEMTHETHETDGATKKSGRTLRVDPKEAKRVVETHTSDGKGRRRDAGEIR